MIKEFIVRKGVFLKRKDSTKDIMNILIVTLIPFVIISLIYGGLPKFITLLICVMTSLIAEYLIFFLKRDKKEIKYLFTDSFTLLSSLLIFLFTTNNTPYLITFCVCIIVAILKILSGGFARYKISPYLLGILILIIFENIMVDKTYLLDSFRNNSNIFSGSNIKLIIIFIMGLITFVYLCFYRYIKRIIILNYFGVVCIMSLIICLISKIDISYTIYLLISGNLLLASMYLAADTIISPLTETGQELYGFLLGVTTVILSFVIPYGYAIVSIFLIHLLVPYINNLTITIHNNSKAKSALDVMKVISLILVCVVIGIII